MPIFLLAAAVASASAAKAPAPSPQVRAMVQTSASIRIMEAVRITDAEWQASANRKERMMRDKSGEQFRLRTIDFQ